MLFNLNNPAMNRDNLPADRRDIVNIQIIIHESSRMRDDKRAGCKSMLHTRNESRMFPVLLSSVEMNLLCLMCGS